MPRGFIGRPSTVYLTQASTAHTNAVNAATTTCTRVAASAPGSANTASRLRVRALPFEPGEGAAASGSVPTGRGNSSNIVVSQAEYESAFRQVCQADERMGECVYNTANEIELLCQTVFILPQAVPRCLNISESVKKSLGQFRAVTEDVAIKARNFAREITDIGW